jgi:hypothetical protein
MLPPAFHMMTNWKVESYFQRKEQQSRVTTRDIIYRILASPASTTPGGVSSCILLLLSAASVITLAVENQQEAQAIRASFVNGRYDPALFVPPVGWDAWNLFILIVFSTELLLRIVCYQRPWRDAMVWVDGCCLAPLLLRAILHHFTEARGSAMLAFYLEQKAAGTLVLLIASTSSLRLLKMSRYFLGTKVA